MAGIGFELKKLFKNKGFLNNIRALVYTSVVTVGPQLLCITMVTALEIIVSMLNIAYTEKEIFLASTLYAFVFSQILTSGFSMLVTRYISDKLYSKEYNKILPSLYGIIAICLILGSITGIIFFAGKTIRFSIKLSTYVLFMELIIMWLETVYLSALKDYLKIVESYLLGMITASTSVVILLYFKRFSSSEALLLSLDIGIFFIITFLVGNIQSFFRTSDKKYFEFIKYIDKYSSLFFISFFYTLGMYVHNFIYWGSPLGRIVANTYIFAPAYDVPTFYAMLTILPASIMFVISVETAFYDRYKDYYSQITMGGNLKDIIQAKKSMLTILWQEIFHLMEVQLFFTIFFVILGYCFLPYIGMTQASIDIFVILTFAAYCTVSMLIILLIELYFENRKEALIIAAAFLFTNILFTLISLILGENYYGLGFLAAALISLAVGLIDLKKFLDDIDYITFCSQPIIYKEKKGLFTYLVNKIYM